MDTKNGNRDMGTSIEVALDQLTMLEGYLVGRQAAGTQYLEPAIEMIQDIRGVLCPTTNGK